ncbi:alpha/beta hydrolase [Brenneria izadpanahii]|uniref:Carboxylic ester hydrolase n=1 Tax=Brenneria izadpanahii TaxID=2722756 RepID=A0ABX7UYS3_9GAMM|nr:alpha/beta hydrolase [Brenneria izadpanahii]QTF09732.1 alpha/beta hydrolase [Brenneria izadpanahii]
MVPNTQLPVDIEKKIKQLGPVIDVPTTKAWYAPLLAEQPIEGVSVRTDIAYGDDERQRVDVYLPTTGANKTSPVLIFVHGGGFVRGDKSSLSNQGYFYARQGMVVVVPNYRLAPAHQWPTGAQDVSSALAWTRTNIAEFGGDPEKIVVAGESAGAAHVAAATLIRRFHPAEGLKIAGAVLISGVYNAQLELLARQQFGIPTPDPSGDAYFGSNLTDRSAMSTVELIDTAPFPLFISYAELDPVLMQVETGELFARLVTQHGFTPDLHVVYGHNHISQMCAVNTGDTSLSGPVMRFLQKQFTSDVL